MKTSSKTPAKTPKLHVKTGDTVIVVAGADKGKKGEILKVFPEKQRAIVSGMKMAKKHIKPTAEQPQGGVIEIEMPIHVSNLMHLDPKSGEPTRIGRKKDESGKTVRYSKKSGEIIK
ncbi:50S ribosomal protein L24 [Hugenholtzia roseola]|uniref:50S ribosomal protein L24 n=1 Tax=Hugenholtzia roseola TaxID=1002 RepID=UPI0004279917|nr:50S ribosomal protein L24 [Hugenholtzia roseola]